MTIIMRTGYKNQSGSQEISYEKFFMGETVDECLQKVKGMLKIGPTQAYEVASDMMQRAIHDVIESKRDEYIAYAQLEQEKYLRVINDINNCKTARDFTFLHFTSSKSQFFFVERIHAE